MATNYFNQKFKELVKIIGRRYYSSNHSYYRALLKGAEFAACAFNLPREEVTNYFNWRQQDAIVILFKWLVKHTSLKPN